MKRRILVQGLLIVALFVAALWLLSRVNWMRLFRVEEITAKTEEKVGNYLLDVFRGTDEERTEKAIVTPIDSMVTAICAANGIDPRSITVHVLENEVGNAFAIPGGHIVVYTGLIGDALTAEVLAGVLAHEIAHVQLNHVARKIATQTSISVLASAVGGASSPKIAEMARLLSSTAFDRKLEREADLTAAEYLQKAGIPTEDFANFLIELGKERKDHDYLVWLNTHPDPTERAASVRAAATGSNVPPRPVIDSTTWHKLQMSVIGFDHHE